MNRKYLLVAIVILVFVIVALIIVFYKSSESDKTKLTPKEKYKLEARVNFISSNGKDTLSVLWVEVADTPYEHSKGLMYRFNMPDTVGMLFIYPDSQERSYWMQNTRMSLDIIYIDNKMRIISVYEFTIPFSEDGLPSNGPSKYVIETNAGYIEENGIEPGGYILIKN